MPFKLTVPIDFHATYVYMCSTHLPNAGLDQQQVGHICLVVVEVRVLETVIFRAVIHNFYFFGFLLSSMPAIAAKEHHIAIAILCIKWN